MNSSQTFKLLLSYRGFIALIIKASDITANPPAFPPRSPRTVPHVWVTFCCSCEIWSLLILRALTCRPHRPTSLMLVILKYVQGQKVCEMGFCCTAILIKDIVNVSLCILYLPLFPYTIFYTNIHGKMKELRAQENHSLIVLSVAIIL